MKLSIVVPAYNEEDAVQDTLRRCMAAAAAMKESGGGEAEVILVNDGSSDRTGELARGVAGVKVLSHEANRGYGAAIKTGFAAASGEWLGFLDADGTCDPAFFVELLKLAEERELDVALGSRMHAGSKMPATRVVGNRFFRALVNLIGDAEVTDTASGMRVLRRGSLERLYPLPDGLNFTPAMSVRAILDPALRIGEVPMPYEERLGRSKLSVAADGWRFLRVIVETALTYRPMRFFGLTAVLLALPALALLFLRLGGPAEPPVPYYLHHARIADWMFFRLILTSVLLATSVFLVSLGLVAQSLVGIINREGDRYRPDAGLTGALMGRFAFWGLLSLLAGVALNHRPLAAYLSTGEIPSEFWVFPVVGAVFVIVGFEFLAFSVVSRIARLLWEREKYRFPGGE